MHHRHSWCLFNFVRPCPSNISSPPLMSWLMFWRNCSWGRCESWSQRAEHKTPLFSSKLILNTIESKHATEVMSSFYLKAPLYDGTHFCSMLFSAMFIIRCCWQVELQSSEGCCWVAFLLHASSMPDRTLHVCIAVAVLTGVARKHLMAALMGI